MALQGVGLQVQAQLMLCWVAVQACWEEKNRVVGAAGRQEGVVECHQM